MAGRFLGSRRRCLHTSLLSETGKQRHFQKDAPLSPNFSIRWFEPQTNTHAAARRLVEQPRQKHR